VAGRAYLGYDPYPTDYVEWHDGEGQDSIILRHWPVLRVNALSIDGDSVGAENAEYFVYEDEGIIRLDAGTFGRKRKSVYVYLYAGLSPWPFADLRQAANEWVQQKYSSRGTASDTNRDIKTERVGDYAVTYEDSSTQDSLLRENDMPKSVQSALERYRTILPQAARR